MHKKVLINFNQASFGFIMRAHEMQYSNRGPSKQIILNISGNRVTYFNNKLIKIACFGCHKCKKSLDT